MPARCAIGSAGKAGLITGHMARGPWRPAHLGRHPAGLPERSGATMSYYIFCREWPSFSELFPFHQFNHLEDTELVPAIIEAVQRAFDDTPRMKHKWQRLLLEKLQADERERRSRQVPLNKRRRADVEEPSFCAAAPVTTEIADRLPTLPTAIGFCYALYALNWRALEDGACTNHMICADSFLRPNKVGFGPRVLLPRYTLAKAGNLDAAASVVQALTKKHGNRDPWPQFWYLDSESINQAEWLIYDQEIEQPGPCKYAADARDFAGRLAAAVEPAIAAQCAQQRGVDTTEWPRVCDATKEAKKKLGKIGSGEISRACTDGAIHSVGTNRDRRIDPASLAVWIEKMRRGREIRSAVEPTPWPQSKPVVSFGECSGCGGIVTLRDGIGKCTKCHNDPPIEPLTNTMRSDAQQGGTRRKMSR